MSEIFVVIDIGTSKVSSLIGKMNASGQVDILGKGSETCSGVKKGNIADVESAAFSIKASVQKAEEMSGFRIKSAFVNISNKQLTILNTKSFIDISETKRDVINEDIDNVMEKIRQTVPPKGTYIIDVVPKGFIADGCEGIVEPLGMSVSQLGAEADIILADALSVRNIMKCMDAAEIKIEGLLIDSLAVGRMFLTQDEMECGALLIDVGGELTNISLLNNNRLLFAGSLPVGGESITNDISIGLRISYSDAKKFKKHYNMALTSLIKHDQEETVADISGSSKKIVKVSEVVEIIEARVGEIFTLCAQIVKASGFSENSYSAVVLTGRGISNFYGAIEHAGNIFGVPVRILTTKSGTGVKPEYMNCAAMVLYASENYDNLGMVVEKSQNSDKKSKKDKTKTKNKKLGFFDKVTEIFRSLF